MEAKTFSLAAGIEADSIIGDLKQYSFVVGSQSYFHSIGATVLYDIVQGFLRDTMLCQA